MKATKKTTKKVTKKVVNKVHHNFSPNVFKKHVGGVGGWGGKCTCPNGQTYWVGDKNNYCGSLACNGGKMGKCNRYSKKKWSGNMVTCGHKLPGASHKKTTK